MSSTRVAIADVVASMLGAPGALSVDVTTERVWSTNKKIDELKALSTPLLTIVPIDQEDERDSRSTFGETYTIDVAYRTLINDQETTTLDNHDAVLEEIARFFRSHSLTNRSEKFIGSEYLSVLDQTLLNQLVYVGIVRLTFAKAGVS